MLGAMSGNKVREKGYRERLGKGLGKGQGKG